jgi:hypothetical protein
MNQTREPITAEVIADTNAALEKTQGNVIAAAQILGVSKNRVYNIINTTDAMRAKWGKGNDASAPSPQDIVDRPPLPREVSPAQATAAALAGQEKKLDKNLRGLGFSKDEITAISSVEDFAGSHFQESLKILHGGMVKCTMRLMLLAEKIYNDYLTDPDMDPKELDRWWGRYFQILENLRESNDASNRAALTQAMVALKKAEAKNANGPGKPGFGRAINITPPSN